MHNAFFDRCFRMKRRHDPETGSLCVERKAGPGAGTRGGGLNVDLDSGGEVAGFDIDHASRRFDLSALATRALPVRVTRAS